MSSAGTGSRHWSTDYIGYSDHRIMRQKFEVTVSVETLIHPIWVYKKHLKCSTSHVSKIFRKNSTGVPFLVLYFALYLDHPNEFSASLIQEVIKEDMRA